MRVKSEEMKSMIIDFIDDYLDQNGYSPSIREISDGIKVPKSTVSRHLIDMKEKGLVDYDGHRNITTERTKADIRNANRAMLLRRVPVAGSIACGIPKFAEENVEEYIKLPVSLFGSGPLFVLRTCGDSMIDAGIDDGDYVVIRQQNYANKGQIVVALLEDEATLKRYYPEPEKQRVRLQPENKTMRPIYVNECLIQGVAVKVIKDLE